MAFRKPEAKPRFPLGMVVATPGAMEAMNSAGVGPTDLLERHAAGDWGKVCAEDAQSNEDAISCGDRILSSYDVGGATVWVITEADRSATTLLTPDEY